MKRKFTTSFKIQAVEKALSRNENSTLTEIANSLGIGASTLSKWIVK
ncbi:transposase, partial [Psychrobacter sp. TB55-MNA-CIBAN-0194]